MLDPTHFEFLGLEILLVGTWMALACGLIPAIAGYLFQDHRLISSALLISNAFLWAVSEQTTFAAHMDICPQKAREHQESGKELLLGDFDCVGFSFDFALMGKLAAWMLPAFLLGWALAQFLFKRSNRNHDRI